MDLKPADRMTKLAALLCAGPILFSLLRSGASYDGGIVSLVLIVVFLGSVLALPQIAMFVAIVKCENPKYRRAALWVSGFSLVAYGIFVFTVDLASSSTASLSLLFFQLYALAIVCVLFGAAVVALRLIERGRNW